MHRISTDQGSGDREGAWALRVECVFARVGVPEELARLSRVQGGALSRAQVRGHGVSDRVIERLTGEGRWGRITSGIYRTQPSSWLQLVWAGVLLGGPDAVVGRSCAAHLHGWLKPEPTPITIYVSKSARTRRDQRWEFLRSPRLGRGEPPRTRPAQTLLDLAASMSADELTTLVAEATAFHRLDPEEVRRLVAARPRLPGRQLLLETLDVVAAGAMSPLETRYLRDVERAHGLPTPLRQASPTGQYRTDAWYPDYGVIIELDGSAYHRGVARTTDLERDSLHLANGIVTLRVTWRMVTTTPCALAATVAQILTRQGWRGTPKSCQRGCAVHPPP